MDSFEKYIGQVFDRRYRINKIIGIGGMAIVFEAQDLVMNRTVAVKMLKEEIAGDAQAVKRFINESKAVAMLSHPNIVAIYDVSVKENLKYIVMERVEGITLKNYMMKKGALPVQEVLHYTEQILKALEHAHAKGIIHRDIKPQNIMLLKNGRIKVTDFGIAKLPNAETVTMTDKAIGTVYYISPEQASGKPIDPRSDLYSLGVMMYEMATGSLPFQADSPVSVALMQVNDKPRRPAEIVPDIPVGLEQIILGAMEKDPAGRFQTAGQMLRYVTQLKSDSRFVFKNASAKTRQESAEAAKKKEKQKPKKQSRTMFPIILGVAAAFLIVMAIGAYEVLSTLLRTQREATPYTITIPALIGAVCNDALTDQFDPTIYVLNIAYEPSDRYSSGTIMHQDPRSGEKRRVMPGKQYCELNLTVSSGAETRNLPDFTYKNYLAVEIELKKLGLTPTIKKIESATVDVGYVIKTIPAAGEEVRLGGEVLVYASSGVSVTTVQVPSCLGMTVQQAYRALKSSTGELQFTIGATEYELSFEYPEGQIIRQSREPLSTVPKGTQISFVVSLGEPETEPPETDPPETDPPETWDPFETDPIETDPGIEDPVDPFDTDESGGFIL